MILGAIEHAGFNTTEQVKLALDVASSEFYKMVNTSLKAKVKP